MIDKVFQQIKQQALFVWRVIVECADLNTDLCRDLAHGNSGIAALREKAQCRILNARTGDISVRALFACHRQRITERAFMGKPWSCGRNTLPCMRDP